MPIEIRELIIRTAVDSAGEKPSGESQADRPVSWKSAAEGLDKLMELIKSKNER